VAQPAIATLVMEGQEDHLYKKLWRHFLKRAPAILARYEAIMSSLNANNITKDIDLLVYTH
jgi:hypothetical protein